MEDKLIKKEDDFDIVVLNFADSKVPQFKETRNKPYIWYGEENNYPEYLTFLYNKSAKHNAIINGKTNYIVGGGLEKSSPLPNGFVPIKDEKGKVVIPACCVNREGDTMFDILQKTAKDIEIYGGFRWAITYDMLGRIAEIYHVDFYKFRNDKECGFWYKEDWQDKFDRDDKPVWYPEFIPNPGIGIEAAQTRIFSYNEYRPGCDSYPLPGYIGSCNYIDCDIEISKFHLSSLRNGMTPSKMIQFYTGEPTNDKKRDIEKRFSRKFAGSENAGKFVLVFNNSKEKTVDVEDLSQTELDKMFDVLNKTVESQIITGHQIVSPMLFGVKTEGQLGGNTELKIAYEIFINTYAKPKQTPLEKIVNYFGSLMGKGNDYAICQLDPIGIIIDIKDVIQSIPTDFIYEKLGIPKEYRGGATLGPLQPSTPIPAKVNQSESAIDINDNIKNLTGRQHQNLVRIITHYTKGKLTREQASTLLKTGLGLGDSDINALLGISDQNDETFQKFVTETLGEDYAIEMFSQCGDLKNDFHIVTSKTLKFNKEEDIIKEELNFFQQAFATSEITNSESKILGLIRKDPLITPEVIAKAIGSTPEFVSTKIAKLTKNGLIEKSTETIGEDEQVKRIVTTPSDEIKVSNPPEEQTQIYIKYSYEVKPGIGPAIIDTTRPFCKKLIELDRLYSRGEIETISERLGYSVWDRRGGWWGDNPTCRHRWISHIVVKKGNK